MCIIISISIIIIISIISISIIIIIIIIIITIIIITITIIVVVVGIIFTGVIISVTAGYPTATLAARLSVEQLVPQWKRSPPSCPRAAAISVTVLIISAATVRSYLSPPACWLPCLLACLLAWTGCLPGCLAACLPACLPACQVGRLAVLLSTLGTS